MKSHWGIHMVTFTLLVIGGLNWGALTLFGWEIGDIFGGMSATASQVLYILIALSAVYEVVMHKKNCRMCNP